MDFGILNSEFWDFRDLRDFRNSKWMNGDEKGIKERARRRCLSRHNTVLPSPLNTHMKSRNNDCTLFSAHFIFYMPYLLYRPRECIVYSVQYSITQTDQIRRLSLVHSSLERR